MIETLTHSTTDVQNSFPRLDAAAIYYESFADLRNLHSLAA